MVKKRLIFVIVLLVFFGTSFLIYDKYQYREKGILEVISLKKDNITKIVLMDGRDIKNPVIIKDKQKINEFLKLTNSDVIKREKNIDLVMAGQLLYVFIATEKPQP